MKYAYIDRSYFKLYTTSNNNCCVPYIYIYTIAYHHNLLYKIQVYKEKCTEP